MEITRKVKNNPKRFDIFETPVTVTPPTRNFKNFKFFKTSLKILNVYFWGTSVYFWGTFGERVFTFGDKPGFGVFGKISVLPFLVFLEFLVFSLVRISLSF